MSEVPTWDEYFLQIAHAVAARAKCTRRKVGAVIVLDRRIIATGYNGAPPGEVDCLEGACPRAAQQIRQSDCALVPGRCELAGL
ncbi:deoxycytidylate deaminase [Actinomyces minihominis]|uniref:deoxycytidylate deaminase n=1 Tax=Actinomyces minihominis TaxID=2002838 RepID=UPI001A931A6E